MVIRLGKTIIELIELEPLVGYQDRENYAEQGGKSLLTKTTLTSFYLLELLFGLDFAFRLVV